MHKLLCLRVEETICETSLLRNQAIGILTFTVMKRRIIQRGLASKAPRGPNTLE